MNINYRKAIENEIEDIISRSDMPEYHVYTERNDESEILSRMMWGYQRLSERARQIIKEFHYENERLHEFLQRILSSEEKSILRRIE